MAEHDIDIDSLFAPGQEAALTAYLRLLHPTDIAELFDYVDEDEWTRITKRLDAERLAEVLTELSDHQLAKIGEFLHTDRLVAAVDELETDDAADVLAELPDDKSAAVLPRLEDRHEIAALLKYPEDSAGGIMQTELCRVRSGATVADAIEAVRRTRDEVEDVLEVYVVDAQDRLVGIVQLADLVVSKPHKPIDELEQQIEAKVTPELDQEQVAQIFGKYDLYTLPVVNADGVLLGRITYDDIHDVLEEEANEDMLAAAGTHPAAEDLVYTNQVGKIAAFRIPWLATSLAGSMAAGFLLSLFARFPEDAIIIASFVPVCMAMTGNVGSQSAMIVTRGFAIGRIDLAGIGRTFTRELSVGLIMGLAAGVVVGVTGFFWQGRWDLGLTVAVAMSVSMTSAAFIGAGSPALFKKLGIDPAIASGPLVTTTCDLLAVGLYLGVATLMLS